MEPTTQKSSSAIPIAIVFGFAMIAIAIFFTSNNSNTSIKTTDTEDEVVADNTPSPVTNKDYIKGNPNAPILMVEYSDYDCPFCKSYHETMHQIMDEYGVDGRLAWVYRQYPLAELHPNSPKISEAALCVGDIGGNDAFWKFTDIIFDKRDIKEQTNVTKLPQYAEEAGVSKEEYLSCVKSGRVQEKLTVNLKDGFNSGARGTPYTVLIVGNQQAVISGAQPYDTVKGIVQNLVDQLDGTFDPDAVEVPETKTNSEGVPILE
ncbi:thioredoxin domain-containing protein [Candidatus Nomurabacteria bacterium]|nr:thioredoxin domain-containing protein [Candidatus Kaiserbacteria bacterium]MCB9814166.1 thioredoxin domain-containing protein [Candidatus Nomurabacteria bacterium]